MSKEIQNKIVALKFALEGELNKRGVANRVNVSSGQRMPHESHVIVIDIHSSRGTNSFEIWKFMSSEDEWHWQSKDLAMYG